MSQLGTAAAGELSAGTMATLFAALAGGVPEGTWQSPGRINLIGEHTDYNGGLALPFALDRKIAVAARRRPERRWRCWSSRQGGRGAVTPVEVELDRLGPEHPRGWARYVAGVAWALEGMGVELPGLDVVIDSRLPVGSGLSSSAALAAAVAVAANDLADAQLSALELVGICHAAESVFVGSPTGTLDQRAVLLGAAGAGSLIDFTSGSCEPVPLGATLPLIVVDTGVRHDHSSGDYAKRRQECEQAARLLGVAALRQASLAEVESRLSGTLAARARHVLGEDARVLEAARRLRAGRAIGDLLDASHDSLRDDFAVSCPELDSVVDACREAGAAGARLTGGGFGGAVIVAGLGLGEARAAAEVALAPFGRDPASVWEATPAAPAGRMD
jgi:galactokinase